MCVCGDLCRSYSIWGWIPVCDHLHEGGRHIPHFLLLLSDEKSSKQSAKHAQDHHSTILSEHKTKQKPEQAQYQVSIIPNRYKTKWTQYQVNGRPSFNMQKTERAEGWVSTITKGWASMLQYVDKWCYSCKHC